MRSGEEVYRRYVIRTLTSGAKVNARAFAGSQSVAATEGKTLDAALAAIRDLLDKRDGRERESRQDGIPTAQEFADAFSRLGSKVGDAHWRMLEALLRAPNRTMTATALAATAGYAKFGSANLYLGKLGRMVAEDLGFTPVWPDGTKLWTWTLATGADPNLLEDDGFWHWTMRPQVADCFVMMNLGRRAG